MAGDWIKMRSNLWDDPRVAAIVDATDSNECAVVGALYWLWSTADQHTEDGVMPGLSLRQIDRKTGVQGFGKSLCDIGWIADHPDGIRIINFEEHNGESAKRRCVEAKRKANARNLSALGADIRRTKTGLDAELEKEKEKEKDINQDQNTCAEPQATSTPNPPKARFDYSTCQFENLSSEMLSAWRDAYPAIDVRQEIAKAKAWLLANPKNRKSNIDRFLTNWLTRAQDNAPRVNHGQAGSSGNGNHQRNLSAADRIAANIARDRAEREAATEIDHRESLAPDGSPVRSQVDESVRGRSGPRERMGSVLEGSFERAD